MLALSAFTSFLLDADIAGRRAPEISACDLPFRHLVSRR